MFDLFYKKLILLPLYASYIMIILPVLFLNKNTSYYNYVPFMFLIMIVLVIIDKFKKYPLPISAVFLAFLLVNIFKLNVNLQENCFLIQFPRTSARRKAVEDVVNNRVNTSDEAKWFLENNYLPYFRKTDKK
jgi:hypothetical protein